MTKGFQRDRNEPKGSLPLIRSTEDKMTMEEQAKDPEKLSRMIKKPFRCLVGMKHTEDEGDDYSVPYIANARYIPPGGEMGFEATYQDASKNKGKKKTNYLLKKIAPPTEEPLIDALVMEASALHMKSRSRGREPCPDLDTFLERNRSLQDSLGTEMLPRSNQSLEDPQSLPQRRTQSLLDSLKTENQSDPLDLDSIRDVQKALREVERKLRAAKTDGRRVSRAKVMKALLTVVNQLDDGEESLLPEPSSTVAAPPPVKKYSHSTNVSESTSHLNVSGSAYNAMFWSNAAFGNNTAQRNVVAETSRENLDRSNDDVSRLVMNEFDCLKCSGMASEFGKLKALEAAPGAPARKDEARAASRTGFNGEDAYMPSSSDDESSEEESLVSEETPDKKPKEKLQKGSFAQAVSPTLSRPPSRRSTSFDFFTVDMNDPGVQDALNDLMWMQTPAKTATEQEKTATKPKPSGSPFDWVVETKPVGSFEGSNGSNSLPADKLDKMRQSSLSRDEEEELTTPTSGTSSPQLSDPTPKNSRDKSWWRRPRTLIKPSSKDTPAITASEFDEYAPQPLPTKVTVTNADYPEKWKDSDYPEKWKDVLF